MYETAHIQVRFFPVAQSVRLQCGRPGFDPWVRKIPCRRKWHPTPVFLPGESHGLRSLVGCSPRDHKESDTTEWLCLLTYLEILGVNVHRPLQVTPENFGWSALSHGSPSVVTIRDSLPIFFSVKTSVQAKTLEEHLAIHWQVKSGSNTISVFYREKLYNLYLMTSMI